jgi:hypothetical protein
MTNTIFLEQPIALQTASIYSHNITLLKKEDSSIQGMIVDPQIQHFSPIFITDNAVSPLNFFQLSCQIMKMRETVKKILQEQGIVIVFLRAYQTIQHQNHKDLKISNYDWLWRGAGQDREIFLAPTEMLGSHVLTDYANNSPLKNYLESSFLNIEVEAQGNFHPLSIQKNEQVISFMLHKHKGKIIFIPRSRSKEEREKFIASLPDFINPECWGDLFSLPPMEFSWKSDYPFSKSKVLQEVWNQKKEEVKKLEWECKSIEQNIASIQQLEKKILADNSGDMNQAFSQILNHWGIENTAEKETICGKGFRVLSVVSDGPACLWMGKKLQSMLMSQRGILLVNPYRGIEPSQRKPPFYSESLIEFAKANNILLLLAWNVLESYSEDKKEIISLIATKES